MRVLLVEDDADLSRQLKTALGDAGYAVDHAADGEEAHYLGDTEPYDVIVLDLGLPKIDGVSVLERWRREGKAARIERAYPVEIAPLAQQVNRLGVDRAPRAVRHVSSLSPGRDVSR